MPAWSFHTTQRHTLALTHCDTMDTRPLFYLSV